MRSLRTLAAVGFAASLLVPFLSLSARADDPPKIKKQYHVGAGKAYGGVNNDGGGFNIKKGKVHPVPPRVDMPAGQVQAKPGG